MNVSRTLIPNYCFPEKSLVFVLSDVPTCPGLTGAPPRDGGRLGRKLLWWWAEPGGSASTRRPLSSVTASIATLLQASVSDLCRARGHEGGPIARPGFESCTVLLGDGGRSLVCAERTHLRSRSGPHSPRSARPLALRGTATVSAPGGLRPARSSPRHRGGPSCLLSPSARSLLLCFLCPPRTCSRAC